MYGTEFESAYAAATSSNLIQCNVIPVGRGWCVEVVMPRRAPRGDAEKMLLWLEDYRSGIRRQHPYWLVGIRTTDRGYAMDVEPAESPRDVVAKAIPFLQRRQRQDVGYP